MIRQAATFADSDISRTWLCGDSTEERGELNVIHVVAFVKLNLLLEMNHNCMLSA